MKYEEKPEAQEAQSGDLIKLEEQISLLRVTISDVIDGIKGILLTVEEGSTCSREEVCKDTKERNKGENRIEEAGLKITDMIEMLTHIRTTEIKKIKKIVE